MDNSLRGYKRLIFCVYVLSSIYFLPGNDFSGRPTSSYPLKISSKGYKGIVFQKSPHVWKIQRKMANKSLYLFGNGMASIEQKILEEVECVCNHLHENTGKPIAFQKFLGK